MQNSSIGGSAHTPAPAPIYWLRAPVAVAEVLLVHALVVLLHVTETGVIIRVHVREANLRR